MNARPLVLFLAAATLGTLAPRLAAKPLSDLISPEKRRATVEQAQKLVRAPALTPLPADLPQPFNPPGFEQPDPEEVRAQAAAAAAAATSASAGPAKPSTDRDLLEHIATRIQPSGIFRVGDTRFLTFGQKRVNPGDILTVTYDGQDYQIEVAAIEQSTFTLRLNKEEYTRPLKPAKSP
ncbi:MAG: hypothetical protein JSS11_13295 [Verrucomicrobia bacterium]|nr:hypothetical protein [Verrucomicrobiota bacterium]